MRYKTKHIDRYFLSSVTTLINNQSPLDASPSNVYQPHLVAGERQVLCLPLGGLLLSHVSLLGGLCGFIILRDYAAPCSGDDGTHESQHTEPYRLSMLVTAGPGDHRPSLSMQVTIGKLAFSISIKPM